MPSLNSIGSYSNIESAKHEDQSSETKPRHHVRNHDRASHIVSQVAEWLHNEKVKKASRKSRKHGGHRTVTHAAADVIKGLEDRVHANESKHHKSHLTRTNSDLSDDGLALEKLEQILSRRMSAGGDRHNVPLEDQTPYLPRRKSTSKHKGAKKLLRRPSTMQSSDTEYQEPDIDVPSAEAVLDNSKTLGYSGGAASSEVDLPTPKKRAKHEKESWLQFKYEIVRLTHTLRLKGWKQLPIEQSGDIDVERLSGALTNAVYVVAPPANLNEKPLAAHDSTVPVVPTNPPP